MKSVTMRENAPREESGKNCAFAQSGQDLICTLINIFYHNVNMHMRNAYFLDVVLNKACFFKQTVLTFFFKFFSETICCGYTLKVPLKALLISTHNNCFHTEIRQIFIYIPSNLERCKPLNFYYIMWEMRKIFLYQAN